MFFSIGEDPVKLGLVASLNQPGGNVTGVYQFTTGLEAKRLGLLHEMVPKATTIAVLIKPNFSAAKTQLRDVQEAAAHLGVQLVVLRANTEKISTLFRDTRSAESGRSLGLRIPVFQQQARAACRAGGAPCSAGDL